ncbi:MAG: hypothetical protein LBI69_00105 [Puniceicoccales bacterium]|nr:hypothetical protein [Puniceicoccales bacterium]
MLWQMPKCENVNDRDNLPSFDGAFFKKCNPSHSSPRRQKCSHANAKFCRMPAVGAPYPRLGRARAYSARGHGQGMSQGKRGGEPANSSAAPTTFHGYGQTTENDGTA